jgi:GNAT superfamily N-acetyltransferase
MLKIIPASTEDIPLIQSLVKQIWPPTYQSIITLEQIDYMVELMHSTAVLTQQFANGYHYLLLYDDAIAIGYAAFHATDTTGLYRLEKLYVDGSYQGQGVGKLFIHHIIDAVKAAGGTILELNVNKYNKARFFYEKQGFTVYEEKDIDIGNGYWMNDYIMRRPL